MGLEPVRHRHRVAAVHGADRTVGERAQVRVRRRVDQRRLADQRAVGGHADVHFRHVVLRRAETEIAPTAAVMVDQPAVDRRCHRRRHLVGMRRRRAERGELGQRLAGRGLALRRLVVEQRTDLVEREVGRLGVLRLVAGALLRRRLVRLQRVEQLRHLVEGPLAEVWLLRPFRRLRRLGNLLRLLDRLRHLLLRLVLGDLLLDLLGLVLRARRRLRLDGFGVRRRRLDGIGFRLGLRLVHRARRRLRHRLRLDGTLGRGRRRRCGGRFDRRLVVLARIVVRLFGRGRRRGVLLGFGERRRGLVILELGDLVDAALRLWHQLRRLLAVHDLVEVARRDHLDGYALDLVLELRGKGEVGDQEQERERVRAARDDQSRVLFPEGFELLHRDAGALALCRLCHEGDALEPGGRDDRHHLGDAPVIHLVGATHVDSFVRAVFRQLLQLVAKLLRLHVLVVDEDVALGVDRHRNRLLVDVERRRLGLRQVDRHAGREQRRRDHEDDEQHEHDVDERRHVDFGHRAVARLSAPAPSAASSRCYAASHVGFLSAGSGGAVAHAVLIDLAREDRRELVGEGFHARLLLGDFALQLVVGDKRRNGGEEAQRCGEQRLGDAGRDDRERGVLGGGDRAERGHDAPDRTEQADERAGRGDRREKEEVGLEPLDLAGDRDVEHLVDAGLQAHERGADVLHRAFPLPHRGDEQARHALRRPRRQGRVELLERGAGPEDRLELVHRALEAGVHDRLIDDDRPRPDRGGEQHHHDDLHQEGRLHEHAEDGNLGDRRRRHGACYIGRVHLLGPSK